MQYLLVTGLFFVAMAACRPSMKIKKTETVTRADTTTIEVPVKGSSNADSVKLVNEVYAKVIKNKIDFNTFAARVKVEFEDGNENNGGTAYFRIRRDSLIWLSLRGPLGIEGFRAMITPDSVVAMYPMSKELVRRPIAFLGQMIRMPFDFKTLQDVIVGNPVYVDGRVTSFSTNANNQLIVEMNSQFYQHLVTLNNNDFTLLHSTIHENGLQQRQSDISYGNFDYSAGLPFATKRVIEVKGGERYHVDMDFKSFAFNQPVSFPFTIPPGYTEL